MKMAPVSIRRLMTPLTRPRATKAVRHEARTPPTGLCAGDDGRPLGLVSVTARSYPCALAVPLPVRSLALRPRTPPADEVMLGTGGEASDAGVSCSIGRMGAARCAVRC